jgi:hypothetical protein
MKKVVMVHGVDKCFNMFWVIKPAVVQPSAGYRDTVRTPVYNRYGVHP